MSPATVSAVTIRRPVVASSSWPQDAEQPLLQADPAPARRRAPGRRGRPGRAPGRAPSTPSSSAASATVNQSPLRVIEPAARSRASARPSTPARCSRTSLLPEQLVERARRPRPGRGRGSRTRSQTRSTSPIRCELSSTRDAARLQRQHEVADVDPAERVERAGRLVEDDELRPGHQRDGQPEPLLHALGEPADPVVGAVGQPDQGQAVALLVGRAPAPGRAGRAGRAPRPRSATAGSGTARAGSRRALRARGSVGRPAEQHHLAGVGAHQAEQHLDDAGLARRRWARAGRAPRRGRR